MNNTGRYDVLMPDRASSFAQIRITPTAHVFVMFSDYFVLE